MSLTTSDAHRTKLKDFVSPVNVKNILEATDVCVKRSVITGIHTEELYDTLHSSWPARTITPADDNYTFMCGRHLTGLVLLYFRTQGGCVHLTFLEK